MSTTARATAWRRTYASPSRVSARKLARSERPRDRRQLRDAAGAPRPTAGTRRASTASAPRMPSVATRRPPSSGPIATCMLSAVPSQAFAESRSSSSTIAGMALRPAGAKIVSRIEAEATRTMRPGKPGRSQAATAKTASPAEVAPDHEPALIGPVGDDAGHRSDEVGKRLGEQQGADRGAGSVRRFQVEHERRDRDAVADERDGPRGPHPPEHAVGEQDVATPDGVAHPGARRARPEASPRPCGRGTGRA